MAGIAIANIVSTLFKGIPQLHLYWRVVSPLCKYVSSAGPVSSKE